MKLSLPVNYHLRLIKIKTLEQSIEKIRVPLEEPKKIVIFTHINPDGDAIGSLLGLYNFLKKLNHSVTPVTPNEFPFFLTWLPGAQDIIIFNSNPQKVIAAIKEADIIFCVDFNDLKRLKDIEPHVSSSKAIKILIDHHPYPSDSFNFYIHRINASAAAELVYDFIIDLGFENIIDSTIAECIYTGIVSDTNCFNYNINDSSTFLKVANLLKYNLDHEKIYSLLYDNYSFNRMRLMGYCLNQKMVIVPQLHYGYIWLNQKELNDYNFQIGDTEGFVNMPLSISGIYISALLTEKTDHVRISCRSKGNFAVNMLCSTHFEGGGHKNAAGGEINLPIDAAIQHFEKIMEIYSDEIQKLYSNS
jgi:phosphoesterase RecJ-like protein